MERFISVDKEFMVDSCIYEYVRNKIYCVLVIRILLRLKVISCCRNVIEDKLILGCEDFLLIFYEIYRRVIFLV